MNLKPEEIKTLYNLLDSVYNRFGKPDKKKEPYTIYKSDLFKQFNIPERLKQPFFKELEKNFILVNKNPSNNFGELQKKHRHPQKISFKKINGSGDPFPEYFKTSPNSTTISTTNPFLVGAEEATNFYKEHYREFQVKINEGLKEKIYETFKEQKISKNLIVDSIVTNLDSGHADTILEDDTF